MPFKLEAPTALEYFATLVQSDAEFPLLEAAISLGQDEDPSMAIQPVLDQVDALMARLKKRLPKDAGTMQKLRILNKFFFDELGFAGNVNHYDDPANSYVHRVLQTRRGIPISLAVLWLELAQSCGLEAQGLGFPGHFLVTVRLSAPHAGQVVIDPFSGASLSKEDLSERLAVFHADTGLVGEGQVSDELLKHHLRAATPREIVTRMLRNLEALYLAQKDVARWQQVRQRLAVLLPY